MVKKIYVINNSGERELLSKNKIINSAKRSGASLDLAKKVADIVTEKVDEEMTTRKIYALIKKTLLKESPASGMKYSLKEAIRKLGPTGHWFEKYVADILKEYGYKTKINQIVKGRCADFEVDVLLWKDEIKEFSFGECKYHNNPGAKVSISTILENFASFIDLKDGKLGQSFVDKKYNLKRAIITNTKFTSKAITYANCYGVTLLGWKYPKGRGLEYYIDGKNLYPVTILPSVTSLMLEELYNKNVLLVKELLDENVQKKLKKSSLPNVNVDKIVKEAKILFKEEGF